MCENARTLFFVENIDFFSETGNPKKMSDCLWSTLVVLGDLNSHHRRQYNLTLQSRWNDNQYSVEDALKFFQILAGPHLTRETSQWKISSCHFHSGFSNSNSSDQKPFKIDWKYDLNFTTHSNQQWYSSSGTPLILCQYEATSSERY